MIRNWISSINHLFERNEGFVLVTLLAVRGSTPVWRMLCSPRCSTRAMSRSICTSRG